MIIAGAGGHAKEILDILTSQYNDRKIALFEDNQTSKLSSYLGFPIIRGFNNLQKTLSEDPEFILGVGNSKLRKLFSDRFTRLGGKLISVVASDAIISASASLGKGVNLMTKVFVSSSVVINEGVLLNAGCNIHHDSIIDEYTEIGPMSTITGCCKIGKYCSLGAGVVLIPNITIGDNVIVAAGSTVISNVQGNCMVAGSPAKIKKLIR